jgi:RNA polymerase-binding transcription factor DksA
MLEARLQKSNTTAPKKIVESNAKKIPKIQNPNPVSHNSVPTYLPPPPPPIDTKLELNDIDDNLPLPPPPLPAPLTILTPPLSSDENDFILPQKSISNHNENNKIKVNYRNKKNLANGSKTDNQSRDDNNNKNDSNNNLELTSRARDRRSYIERNFNEFNVNDSNSVETSKIASGLENGEHPVCDKCKNKITRYVLLRL